VADEQQLESDGRPGRSRPPLGAWQPLTGGGVAAFGAATFARTLGFQLVIALVAALAVAWSVHRAWFPPFRAALTQLPERAAEVRGARLSWPDTNAVTLGENPQLAVAVDPTGLGDLGRSADLQLELRHRDIRLSGVFGEQFLPYPADLRVSLDRTGGPAAWGAWNWVGLVFVGALTLVTLFAGWWLTGIGLAPFLCLAAFCLRRELTLGGAWRLVAAAWLPATLLFTAGLVLYAMNGLRLTGLAITLAASLALLPLWLLWAVLVLPGRSREKLAKNPFNSGSPVKSPEPGKAKKENPFGKADH
jgi:hypothetical protein